MKLQIGFFVALAFIAIALVAYSSFQSVSASAPSGLPATIATSSTITLPANTATLLVATSSCSARIITASSTAIYLTFSDYAGQSPSPSIYHAYQAASSTVVYDSGEFGCGLVKAWSQTSVRIGIVDSQ